MKNILCMVILPFATRSNDETIVDFVKFLKKSEIDVLVVEKPFYISWFREVLDTKNRLEKIKEKVLQKSKKYKKIILFGISMGGGEVATVAMNNSLVSGIVTINGYFNKEIVNPELKKFRKTVRWLSFLGGKFGDLEKQVRRIKPGEIKAKSLVVYTEDDEVLSVKNSLWFYEQLNKNKKLMVLPTGGHLLRQKMARKIVWQAVVKFILNIK